jgi:S-adenosylmethionine decarboxylase
MERLGKHLLAELLNCDEKCLNNLEFIKHALLSAAKISHLTVVKHFFHEFSPYGISGVVIIAQSHLTIHTWPEHGYAAVDIFTCCERDVRKSIDYLKEAFSAERALVYELQRGIVPEAVQGKGVSHTVPGK